MLKFDIKDIELLDSDYMIVKHVSASDSIILPGEKQSDHPIIEVIKSDEKCKFQVGDKLIISIGRMNQVEFMPYINKINGVPKGNSEKLFMCHQGFIIAKINK